MKHLLLIKPRHNRTVVRPGRPGLFVLAALSALAGCGGSSSSVPVATTLPQQSGALTGPHFAAKKHGQTIFISDGVDPYGDVYLFRGDGKKPKPYTTLSGGGSAFELAVDNSGTLYDPVEYKLGWVLEYSAGYNQPPKKITDGIVYPRGVAASADGTLYVSNCGYNNCSNPFITVYAPGHAQPSRTISNTLAGQMAVDRKGRFFVCDETFGFIDYYKKGSSQYIQAHFQGVSIPNGIATDNKGNYYLSSHPNYSYGANFVLEYGPTGVDGGPVTRKITSDGQPNGFVPQGLAVDDRGNLYVADLGNDGIAVFAPGQTTAYAFIPYGGLAVAVTHSL